MPRSSIVQVPRRESFPPRIADPDPHVPGRSPGRAGPSVLVVLVVAFFGLPLVAVGCSDGGTPTPPTKAAPAQAETSAPTPTPTPTPAPTPTPTGLERSASPDGASVYFISPMNGARVTSPVVVRFGLRKMGVAPAGVEKEATGHHHLVIDAELPRNDLPIPNNDQYRHFGKGQTEVVLSLEPGEHTLQLVLGDHLHRPHDPPVVSERIRITVEAPATE